MKNKLFFFGDYIRTNDDLGRVNRYVVPTAAMRNGDFSASSTPIFDPLTGDQATGANRTQFPNNQIPTSRISPIAQRILANVPLPNIDAPLGQANYQDTTTRERRTDGFDVKINYQVSSKDQTSIRYSYQRPTVFEPSNWGGDLGGPYQDGFIGFGENTTYAVAGNWTRTWSNTLVMDARVGVSTYHNVATSAGNGLRTAADIGIPGANLDEYTSGMTRIEVQNGWSNPIAGYSPSLPWDRGETTLTTAVTMTKLWGNHTVKFGGDYRHNEDYLLQTQDQGGPRGRYQFGASQTASPANAASQTNIANSFAAFLLDRPSNVSRDLAVIQKPGTVYSSVFSFIHDKWQVGPKMTIDLGLRHEYYTPLRGIEGAGGLSNYDPVTNSLLVSGYGSISESINVKSNFRNFNPRTGVSYRPTDKTVIRAGYGASTAPFPDNTYAYNFPVKQNNVFNAPNAFVPPTGLSMAAGFPAPVVANIPQNGIIDAGSDARLRNQQYFVVPEDLKEGMLHSWNVAFQRELGWNFTGEVAYVGNRGQDIIQRLDLNASLTPGRSADGSPLPAGNDNAGRPQFAPFQRTAATTAFLPYKTTYQLDAGEARSPLEEQLPDHQLVHARQGHELWQRRQQWRHQHAGRHRAELGPDGERSEAHVRQQLRVWAAVPEGRHPRLDHQRLAVLGDLHRRSRARRSTSGRTARRCARRATPSVRTRTATPRSSAASATASSGSIRRCSACRRRTRSAT